MKISNHKFVSVKENIFKFETEKSKQLFNPKIESDW